MHPAFIYEITSGNFVIPFTDHIIHRDRSPGSTPRFGFKVLSSNPITQAFTCHHVLVVNNDQLVWRRDYNCNCNSFSKQDNFIQVLIQTPTGSPSFGHVCMIRVDGRRKTLQYFNPSKCTDWVYKEVEKRIQRLLTTSSAASSATSSAASPATSSAASPFHGWRWLNDDQTYFRYNGELVGPQYLIQDYNCGIWCILWAHLCSCNPKMSSCDIWRSFYTHFIDCYGYHGWRLALTQWMQRYKYWCGLLQR